MTGGGAGGGGRIGIAYPTKSLVFFCSCLLNFVCLFVDIELRHQAMSH